MNRDLRFQSRIRQALLLSGVWLVAGVALADPPRPSAAPKAAAKGRRANLLGRLYPDQLPVQPPRSSHPAELPPASPAAADAAMDDSATTAPGALIDHTPHATTATLSLGSELATTATLGLGPRLSLGATTLTLPRVELDRLAARLAPALQLPNPAQIEPATEPTTSHPASSPQQAPSPETPGPPLPPGAIAINSAVAAEVMEKLKVDARRARLIIEFRQSYGPFRRPDDLTQVNGITDAMLALWEERGLLVFD